MLVMAYSTSCCSCPLRQVILVRRQTCWLPGQSTWPARRVVVCKRRCTRRPCSLVFVSATSIAASRDCSFAGGKSGSKLGRDRFLQVRLIVLHHDEVIS